MNSCNPVFIEVGLRLGVDNYYRYFQQFGLMKKTGIDLPGEAATIMHKKENVGEVELATISFGQSFQITPIQLATTVSSIINGGRRITPHFGVKVTDSEGNFVEELKYKEEPGIISKEVSKEVCQILEKVVAEGSGKNAAIEGRSIGGKKPLHPKRFQEVLIDIYPLFWDLIFRKPSGFGYSCYSQSTGNLLWRYYCSACDKRSFRHLTWGLKVHK